MKPASLDSKPGLIPQIAAFTVTLPLLATRNFELLPIMKLIEPPGAMLLMRYSCVTLLKPWNCASAPNWS